jgi:hypothetical protein
VDASDSAAIPLNGNFTLRDEFTVRPWRVLEFYPTPRENGMTCDGNLLVKRKRLIKNLPASFIGRKATTCILYASVSMFISQLSKMISGMVASRMKKLLFLGVSMHEGKRIILLEKGLSDPLQ